MLPIMLSRMQQESIRAGSYIRQPTGYRAFVPKPLPPDPPLKFDGELLSLLSAADHALGGLSGATTVLPNPDLFVMMYVKKEAVLSSQIEGTQASLTDVLELEANVLRPNAPKDAGEITNYINALNHGISRLTDLPVSMRLIREIHELLMRDTRGKDKDPGEFRRSQNWIGAEGCGLIDAKFVPPAPEDMKIALADLEKFLHDPTPWPTLIQIGLAHAQFETIHPFLDGNGRVGRLLVTFLLLERGLLNRPLLYISHYFKQNRTEYYDRLQAVRDKGQWEDWIKFFLRGVAAVATDATDVGRRVILLREAQRERIQTRGGRNVSKAFLLHEKLFSFPYVTVQVVEKLLGCNYATANNLVKHLESAGILKNVLLRQRNRVYSHHEYLRQFQEGEDVT